MAKIDHPSNPSQGSRLRLALGVAWAALLLLTATVSPVEAKQDQEQEIQLLGALWEDASVVIQESDAVAATDAQDEAAAEDVIGAATLELSQATDALDTQIVWGAFAGPSSSYLTPIVVNVPSAEDLVLLDALSDAGTALVTAEDALSARGSAQDVVVEEAKDALSVALADADVALDEAAVGASTSQLAELEEADDALNLAVAAISDVAEEDSSWIADLNGWVPNVRYAIDPRGPQRRLTGAGIDIAVIDSGITPVKGLDAPGKIINGPDLSNEGVDPALTNLDGNGHGTHLAGIIAGNDGGPRIPGVPYFTGIAPNARLVNVKVADASGDTSMEQLVAGIEWVILNKNTGDLDIRVITLAFGYDGGDRFGDPLSAAIEEAWANGIVVVVAGGNAGNNSNGLDNPAIDPFIIAVAGSDQGVPTNFRDDSVASWSSEGDGFRNPDLAAPGRSIVSLRVPGSNADVAYPKSQIGSRFAVASGTSQAAAVMAGTVALLLERDPSLTPDQVKKLLTDGARNVAPGENLDGNGRVRLNKALWRLRIGFEGPAVQQTFSRVSVPDGFGTANGGWAGTGWTGAGWSGAGWSGAGWSGAGWSGAGWSGAGWSGAGWSGAGWSGAGWSGNGWSGNGWS